MQRIREVLRKDGWLLCLLSALVILCLLLGDSGSGAASPTAEEARLAQVLSAMEGAGSVEAVICYEDAEGVSVPCSAVIVADGAGDVAVRLKIIRAVTTLLGIDNSRVEVFQREGGSSHGRMDP